MLVKGPGKGRKGYDGTICGGKSNIQIGKEGARDKSR